MFRVPTFCLITGASRGVGRGLALELAKAIGEPSVMVLTARSDEDLKETKRLVKMSGTRIEVNALTFDLSNMESLSSNISSLFSGLDVADFEHVILVNNAASLGDTTKTIRDLDDPNELQSYYGFNLTSAICLTSKFLQVFPQRNDLRRTVINMSSNCALTPHGHTSLYCSAKTARDMFFRVLTLEEPDVRVLNYVPGVVDTDMLYKWRDETSNQAIKARLQELTSTGQILSVETTCRALLKHLEEDSFKSGSHIDYYDIC